MYHLITNVQAYSLYGGGKGPSDSYKTAVIDTIVAEVQSTPGEDRCVLLLGYKTQIEEMFQVSTGSPLEITNGPILMLFN